MVLPAPNKDGFFDWEELFIWGVGRLGLSVSEYYDLTPRDIGLILQGKRAEEREMYRMFAHVVTVGYSRTQTKKKIPFFDEEDGERKSKQTGTISKEEKRKELSDLAKLFS